MQNTEDFDDAGPDRPVVQNMDRAPDPRHRIIAARVSGMNASNAGGDVGTGDDVVVVEAMKMEIPVASPAAGKIKSILVNVDDVVAEGQTVATLEA